MVIFSNRPFKRPEDDFLKPLEHRMHTYELKRFAEAEVLEYIDQLAETPGKKERVLVQTLLSIKRDSGSQIYERSQGVPLRVGILVNMLLAGFINPSDLDRMASPI